MSFKKRLRINLTQKLTLLGFVFNFLFKSIIFLFAFYCENISLHEYPTTRAFYTYMWGLVYVCELTLTHKTIGDDNLRIINVKD